MEPLWSPVVATGGNQRQIGSAREWRKQAKTVATGCHRLPETFHGKQGVCRGLPPGRSPPCEGGGRFPRSARRQVLRTRRPTGLDSVTLTRAGSGVNGRHACATHRHAETGREALVRRRVTTTVMASAMPVSASVKSATLVTVIALSVGATAASNANSSIKARAARTLSRRQSQSVLLRNRAAKTAAAAGTEIDRKSVV